MTAVSLINPYAPQPVQSVATENALAPAQSTPPVPDATTSNLTGNASDQSGQGAGNGTGTGGAQLQALLKQSRDEIEVQNPTPQSVVEARSGGATAADFLDRQDQQQIAAQADAAARAADEAAARAAQLEAEAAAAALPKHPLPNPLPTAPILKREGE